MTAWEEVEVPRGAYIGWGKIGQTVVGKVLAYDAQGGEDFNGNTCPQVELELLEAADSYNKALERATYPAGDLVVVTAGLVSLKRAIRKADPATGDLLKMTFSSEVKTGKGTVKEFEVKVSRGTGGGSSASAAAAPADAAPEGFSKEEWDALSDASKARLRNL